LPLDGRFNLPGNRQGAGVTIYVVDGGVLTEHVDFGGRATAGPDFSGAVPFRSCSQRIPSHGTHTAGLAASRTYGVAKQAKVVDVRVLGCDGKTTRERMEDALRWVAANAVKPAVVSMSVGSSDPKDEVDEAAQALIDAGIPLILSAGNEEIDACRHYPSNVRDAIVVGASSSHDVLAPFSNTGPCVDVVAPGWEVVSTYARRNDASGAFYGTSQAAPLVAGAAALFLERYPNATPSEVEDAIVGTATEGVLKSANRDAALPGGTPNRLLNVRRLLEL
jgi:subtilisin family serine protease